eukprot:403370278
MKCSQYLNLGDRSKFLLKSASDPIIKNIEFQDCELYEHFNFIASRTAENQCIRFNNQFKKSFLGLYQSYIVIFEESKNEQIQTPLYYFDINMSYFRKCKPQQNTKKELNTTAIHLELLFEDVSYQFQFIYPNIDTYKQWYQQGGTLSDTITQTNQILEKDLQVIMAQLLLAIDYMHDKNIMHRDLKLANILLTSKAPGSYDLRIADFGLACELRNDGKTLERCGTPTYIAPEILQGQDYNTKVDIFSLGSIMFNLISGRYLFSNDGNGPENIIYLNKMCDLTHISQYTQGVSDEARDLLFKLLEKNPQNRISPRDALMHPWFKADQEALETLDFKMLLIAPKC